MLSSCLFRRLRFFLLDFFLFVMFVCLLYYLVCFAIVFSHLHVYLFLFFFFKQKTAYEMRISDWSSDVCSSDLCWSDHSPTTPPPTPPAPSRTTTNPGENPLAEIIVVTSGKGGVGKTTSSASLACGLARRGKKVVVIDFAVGLRNLDLIMGCERRVVYDFVNVTQGEASLRQALIKDKRFENLYVLAASQTRDKDALTKEGVEKVLKDLADDDFDYIICDSPAGIEKGAFLAMYFADKAVVVVNPEVSSVRDSDRILGLLDSKTRHAEDGESISAYLLLTRYNPQRVDGGEMLSVKDVEAVLGLKTIGVIPESGDVLNASNKGEPVILEERKCAVSGKGVAVARRMGGERPMRFTQLEKQGFFH